MRRAVDGSLYLSATFMAPLSPISGMETETFGHILWSCQTGKAKNEWLGIKSSSVHYG
jgi:hypothetical protein